MTYIRHKRHELIRGFLENHMFFKTASKGELVLPTIKHIKNTDNKYIPKDILVDDEEDIEMVD